MLRISRLYIFLLTSSLFFVSCSKSEDENSVKWGKVNCYDNFLWKKYVPDTLYRDLVFDFNSDAKMFMGRPLKMGLFKKNDIGKMVLVKEDEMSLYVDGKQCADNLVDVESCDNSIEHQKFLIDNIDLFNIDDKIRKEVLKYAKKGLLIAKRDRKMFLNNKSC